MTLVTKMKRFYKNWTVHNMVAHPLMGLFELIGLTNAAKRVHDATLPPNV